MLTQLTSLMWHVLMMSSLLLSLCLNNNKDANDDKHNNNNIQKEVRRSVSLINHVPFHFFFLCIPHHIINTSLQFAFGFRTPLTCRQLYIFTDIYRLIHTSLCFTKIIFFNHFLSRVILGRCFGASLSVFHGFSSHTEAKTSLLLHRYRDVSKVEYWVCTTSVSSIMHYHYDVHFVNFGPIRVNKHDKAGYPVAFMGGNTL